MYNSFSSYKCDVSSPLSILASFFFMVTIKDVYVQTVLEKEIFLKIYLLKDIKLNLKILLKEMYIYIITAGSQVFKLKSSSKKRDGSEIHY